MKILILLALVGIILLTILPPPAAGIRCVVCGLGERPCKDYKKGKGDTAYEKQCDPSAQGCMAFKDYKGPSLCSGSALNHCQNVGDYKMCFCDKDLCNGSTKALGGSGAGILLISFGLGLILRQLFH